MTRTTLRVLLFGASLALTLGTGCSDDEAFFVDAGEGGDGTDAGTGGGGGTDDSDAGGNPALDVSVGDDTGSGGGGETDTGGGGGTSDLDCVGIIDCINASGGTQAEFEACIDEGTPEAQGQITDLLVCLQENCDGITDEDEYVACQQEFCTPEIAACTGQAAPSGDATCSETIECLLGCGQDEACGNECVANADGQETLNAVSDYAACASEACTTATSIEEFYACAEAECPDEFAACE